MNSSPAMSRPTSPVGTEPPLVPPVHVTEDATGISLRADLPGVSRDLLNLEVGAEHLTLEGELDLNLPEGMEATNAEVGLSRWLRVFTLSKELDSSGVMAELMQGVLTPRIPKAQHAQPRRIEVKVG